MLSSPQLCGASPSRGFRQCPEAWTQAFVTLEARTLHSIILLSKCTWLKALKKPNRAYFWRMPEPSGRHATRNSSGLPPLAGSAKELASPARMLLPSAMGVPRRANCPRILCISPMACSNTIAQQCRMLTAVLCAKIHLTCELTEGEQQAGRVSHALDFIDQRNTANGFSMPRDVAMLNQPASKLAPDAVGRDAS